MTSWWPTTEPKLAAATRMYEELGSVRRDAYYETPVVETIFMELPLNAHGQLTGSAARPIQPIGLSLV